MKKINNIILYKDLAYVNNQNTNITKDKIVALFDNAYDEGCMNFKKEKSEICTNYIFEQEQEKTIVTIPTILIELNKKIIEQLDDILLKVEQVKKLENERQEKIEKQAKIKKLKKYGAIASLATIGAFTLIKGAIEIERNLEMVRNHKEAIEHYYEDKMIEEQEEIGWLEQQTEQFNREQTQKMIDDMEQYRDLDTMPYVEKVR